MNLRFLILAVLAALPLHAVDFTHGYAVSVGNNPQVVESAHADESFPLMSVVKFPLAIVVLHEVEQGYLSLDTRYQLGPEQLPVDTWSPLATAHPQGGEFTLLQLLQAAVAQSDNNACAQLFRLVGGEVPVQQFFRERMGKSFPLVIAHGQDYFRDRRKAAGNHVSPRAMVQLLHACFVEARLLSPEHTQLLWNIMAGPSAGTPRLGGGIQEGVTLAHKTGSSGMQDGMTLAHNDVGVLRLPDGRTACVASFIRDSRADAPAMDAAHAALARRAAALLGAGQE